MRLVLVLYLLKYLIQITRIVLEHCSTEAAVAAVLNAGETVAGSITPHHMWLIVDDWAGGPAINYCSMCFLSRYILPEFLNHVASPPGTREPFSYFTCSVTSLVIVMMSADARNNVEPVAKTPRDRIALLKAAASGNPKFFLGSDSAPHPIQSKQGNQDGTGKHAAGVWTQPFVLSYALDALEQGCKLGVLASEQLTQKTLAGFLGEHGRTFYKEGSSEGRIIVGPSGSVQIPEVFESKDRSVKIVPFRTGQYTRGIKWL